MNESVVLETCGLYGESKIRVYNLYTNEIIREHKFVDSVFAEGVCKVGDFLYVLTYKEKCILKLLYSNLDVLGCIMWPWEGWGMTYDNNDTIYITDGSHYVTYVNASVLNQQQLITPHTDGFNKAPYSDHTNVNFTAYPYIMHTQAIYCNRDNIPTTKLNELEYINASVYANVWYTRYVVRIDAATGLCDARLDFATVYTGTGNTMNGIAYLENKNADLNMLVTGKHWTQAIKVDFSQVHLVPNKCVCIRIYMSVCVSALIYVFMHV